MTIAPLAHNCRMTDVKRALTFVGAGLLGLVLALGMPPAAALAGGPTDHIKQGVDRAIQVLQDPALKPEAKRLDRRRLLRAIADEMFDFEEMSRRALGPHWRPLTEAQRREFSGLFADLLERTYMSTIERFSGESIVYVGERVADDYATVYTHVVRKEKPEIPIDYRMLQRNGRWFAYDVAYEGVSLAANYRTQFSHIIQTSSFDELVKKLRSRAEERQEPTLASQWPLKSFRSVWGEPSAGSR